MAMSRALIFSSTQHPHLRRIPWTKQAIEYACFYTAYAWDGIALLMHFSVYGVTDVRAKKNISLLLLFFFSLPLVTALPLRWLSLGKHTKMDTTHFVSIYLFRHVCMCFCLWVKHFRYVSKWFCILHTIPIDILKHTHICWIRKKEKKSTFKSLFYVEMIQGCIHLAWCMHMKMNFSLMQWHTDAFVCPPLGENESWQNSIKN